MSRYTKTLSNGRTIAWGYDTPLQEYFLTEFWTAKEAKQLEDMEEGIFDPEVVFSIMSYTTTCPHPDTPDKLHYSNGEILKLMERYPEIPTAHKKAVMLDMPF